MLRYTSIGDLDSTFSGDGMVFADFGADNDIARGVALASGGGIVVGGLANSLVSSDFGLAFFRPNGRRDGQAAGQGLVVADLGGNDRANALALQPDGRIVLAGTSDGDFALTRHLGVLSSAEGPRCGPGRIRTRDTRVKSPLL